MIRGKMKVAALWRIPPARRSTDLDVRSFTCGWRRVMRQTRDCWLSHAYRIQITNGAAADLQTAISGSEMETLRRCSSLSRKLHPAGTQSFKESHLLKAQYFRTIIAVSRASEINKFNLLPLLPGLCDSLVWNQNWIYEQKHCIRKRNLKINFPLACSRAVCL